MAHHEIGTLLSCGDGLYVIARQHESGLWENAPTLYSAWEILPAAHFAEHDQKVGLPGCCPITEQEWLQKPEATNDYPAWVIVTESAFMPTDEADRLEVVGFLNPKKVEGVRQPSPETCAILTDEDWKRRLELKEMMLEDLHPLWRMDDSD